MIDYAPMRPGPGFRPTRAAMYYCQRVVTGPSARRLVARAVAAGVNLMHPDRDAGASPDATEQVTRRAVEALSSDGYAVIDDLLSPSAIAEIDAYLRNGTVVIRPGGEVPFDQLPQNVTAADVPLASVLKCPHVLELANHPVALRIAVDYLGCLPTISTIGIRWSLPGPGSGIDTQNFHRDPDDFRFFKLFVYLTDVDADSAPHLFVVGSHKTSGKIRAGRYPRDELERDYGADKIIAITGKRGTTFVADTYGIHSGGVPRTRPRVMLEVGYSVLPIFALQYRPMLVEHVPALDRYVNRLLVA